jgi:hypothetical protein
MPLGPSDVRSTRDTALAAWMLAFTASMPLTRVLLSCSCAAEGAIGAVSGGGAAVG